MQILIGADPEFFLKRRTSRMAVSAHGMVKGTKAKPQRVKKGAVQVDGTALEINIDPAKTFREFDVNITTVLDVLRDMIPSRYDFDFTSHVTYDYEVWKKIPIDAQDLGCDPDFNAYTMEMNRRPRADATQVRMRTASGHVHIGWTSGQDPFSAEHMDACVRLTKQLDIFLGLASRLRYPDTQRKALYGRAGAFRPKPYGLEYRVLHNFWVPHKILRKWVYDSTILAVQNLIEGKEWNPLKFDWRGDPGYPRPIGGIARSYIDAQTIIDAYRSQVRDCLAHVGATEPPRV